MGLDRDSCDTELGLGIRSIDRAPRQLDLLPAAPVPREWSKDEGFLMSRQNVIDVNKLPWYCNEPEEAAASHAVVSSPNSTISSFHVDSNVITQEASYAASIKRERDAVTEEAEVEKAWSRVSDEEEEGGGARKKLRLSKDQSAVLEESFRENSTLNPKQKQALAKQLNLRPRQVEVWFQNRRARTKLKQTEVDCEFLKRYCESLTEENKRLHKELQELRALKLAAASPLYMRLPAATLTMCPSCERVVTADNSRPFNPLPKPQFYPFPHSSAAC